MRRTLNARFSMPKREQGSGVASASEPCDIMAVFHSKHVIREFQLLSNLFGSLLLGIEAIMAGGSPTLFLPTTQQLHRSGEFESELPRILMNSAV